MKSIITLASLFLLLTDAQSLAVEDCRLSDWQDWSTCAGHEPSSSSAHAPFSFSLPATQVVDRGRAMMERTMAEKMELYRARRQCQLGNSCPEFNPKPSEFGRVNCDRGMAGDYPCRNVDMMSHISIEDLGYSKEMQEGYKDPDVRGNDIWGWTDPETDKEYAIVGTSGGTSFVDVTDPVSPTVLAFLPTHSGPSIWRDMKVVNNVVYIVSEARDHGLQVFDLARLRSMTSFSYVKADTHYGLFGNAHNIIANPDTGYVYVVGARQASKYEFHCNGGLHFVNVLDPLNPAYAGCYPDDGYTHDAQCVIYHGPDRRYQGREICFSYNEDTLTLVDVTDKQNPTLVSKRGYSYAMYTHQGWLTEDHTLILLDDEKDERFDVTPDSSKAGQTVTYLWDMTDLEDPVLRGHYISTEVAVDHNQYIHGDLVYQSNYGAGLRILHIDQDLYELKEVAYFDCLPNSSPVPVYEGTWSNYPYFKSGNVIVSSIEYGLFVVRPDHAAIQAALQSDEPYKQQTRHRTIEYAKPGALCAGLVESRDCTHGTPALTAAKTHKTNSKKNKESHKHK